MQVDVEQGGAVPRRVRRLANVRQHVQKMQVKEECTYAEGDVLMVHRCKKRRRLSAEEKAEV